jgi:hypothetical protein
MIPRTVEQIFATSEALKDSGWVYKMDVMYLEIYNETIFDLLVNVSIITIHTYSNVCIYNHIYIV